MPTGPSVGTGATGAGDGRKDPFGADVGRKVLPTGGSVGAGVTSGGVGRKGRFGAAIGGKVLSTGEFVTAGVGPVTSSSLAWAQGARALLV